MGVGTGTALLGAGALNAGANALSSGKGGGGGGSDMAELLAGRQAKMATNLWNITDPMRNAIINQLGGFLGLTDPLTLKTGIRTAGYKPTPTTFNWQYDKYGNTMFPAQYSPVFGAARQGIENAYSQGRQNIIGSMPAGGAMLEQLGGLEKSRATDYGNLYAGIAQDLYNKAYGLATGVPGQAMGGLSGAGSTALGAGQQGLMAQQMQNQLASGKGQGMGSLTAMMLMGQDKPWILKSNK